MEVVPAHVNQTAQVHAAITAPAVAEAVVLMAVQALVQTVAVPHAQAVAQAVVIMAARGRHE